MAPPITKIIIYPEEESTRVVNDGRIGSFGTGLNHQQILPCPLCRRMRKHRREYEASTGTTLSVGEDACGHKTGTAVAITIPPSEGWERVPDRAGEGSLSAKGMRLDSSRASRKSPHPASRLREAEASLRRSKVGHLLLPRFAREKGKQGDSSREN